MLYFSNTGGDAISKFAYQHFISGKNRDEITFKDIENVLEKDVFNQPGLKYILFHLERVIITIRRSKAIRSF